VTRSLIHQDGPVRFVAHGVPKTQGSAKAVIGKRTRKAVLIQDHREELRSWRSVVGFSAVESMRGRDLFDGAVRLTVTFVLIRPKSAPKSRVCPEVKPDLDKLLRGIGDALTGVVYTEDSRIVEIRARKIYGSPARAEIEVEPI